MEILILLVIAGIAVCVFTGNPGYILLAAAGILLLLFVLMTILFLYCTLRLVFSKKKGAVFVRIDKPGEDSRFKVAFYMVDGREYPCLFPEEGVFRSKLYRKERKCHVFVNYRMEKVFDRYAVTTCILGLVCSIALGTGMVMMFLR